MSACAWSVDGKTIGGGESHGSLGQLLLLTKLFAACEDGAIHLWSASSNFARPNAVSLPFRGHYCVHVGNLRRSQSLSKTPTQKGQ